MQGTKAKRIWRTIRTEISTYAKEVADCMLVEIKTEKLVPAISEKKQYTVAMNVINVPINRNV